MFSFHCGVFTYPSSGPNELSICDASLIHRVLGQGGLPKGPRACMLPLYLFTHYMRSLGWDGDPSLIAQRDPVKHMHRRKPWNRAFSSTAIKEYEHIVANRIRQLVNCLENSVHGSSPEEGALLDIAAWLNYFT